MFLKAGRRKVASSIFADVAKYSLAAGAIGGAISEEVSVSFIIGIVVIATVSFALSLYAYPNE